MKDITYASLSPLPEDDRNKNDRSGPRKNFNVSEMDLNESLIKVGAGKKHEAVKLKQLFPNKSYSNLAAIVGNPCYNMGQKQQRQNGGTHIPMTKPKVNTELNLVSQRHISTCTQNLTGPNYIRTNCTTMFTFTHDTNFG